MVGVIKDLKEVTSRIEILEEGLRRALDKHEEVERVRRILSCVEEKNRSLERSLENVKVHLSCIINAWLSFHGWSLTAVLCSCVRIVQIGGWS